RARPGGGGQHPGGAAVGAGRTAAALRAAVRAGGPRAAGGVPAAGRPGGLDRPVRLHPVHQRRGGGRDRHAHLDPPARLPGPGLVTAEVRRAARQRVANRVARGSGMCARSDQAASRALARRPLTYSTTIGMTEMTTIAIAIASRLFLIHGMLPRKYPSKVMLAVHSTAPIAE